MISFKEYTAIQESMGGRNLGLSHPQNMGMVKRGGMNFDTSKMPKDRSHEDENDEDALLGKHGEPDGDEEGEDDDDLGVDDDNDLDDLGDSEDDEEGEEKPKVKKKPMAGVPHDNSAFMGEAKKKMSDCGEDGEDMDVEKPEGDEEGEEPGRRKRYMKKKCGDMAGKSYCKKCSAEMKKEGYLPPAAKNGDREFLKDVASHYGVPVNRKFFNGVHEDMLIPEPEAGEVGHAPEARVGQMSQVVEAIQKIGHQLAKLERRVENLS